MKKINEYSITELKNLPKDEVLNLIREKLKINTTISEHRRFEMSGYDGGKTGNCTIHNINILNEFANLGIYNYTEFLFLDFYKGTPTIYLKYWLSEELYEDTYGGFTTSEIIYEIFKLTIFRDKEIESRRRDD